MMPSSHLILCRPLLLLPSIPPSIRVFSNESTLRMRWPKYWSFSLSMSFQRTPRADLLQNGLGGSPCSPRDSQESSPTPQFKSINSWALSFLHSPTLRRRKWQPTPVLLPGKSHGQRSLVDYSPWDHKESATTERLHFHSHYIELSTM